MGPSSPNDLQAGADPADKGPMNRTRLFVALLGAIFLSAVGVGVVIGQEDRPMTQVASTAPVETTTTVPRPTTTRAPATTTSTTRAPAPTTTPAPPPPP